MPCARPDSDAARGTMIMFVSNNSYTLVLYINFLNNNAYNN